MTTHITSTDDPLKSDSLFTRVLAIVGASVLHTLLFYENPAS